MNILSLEGVSKSYGVKPLLSAIDLGLDEQDKVGVIGVNGSGKSTLLRLVAGLEAPDEGRVVRARDRVFTLLSQDPPTDPEQTVMEAVFAGDSTSLAGKLRVLEDYEAACHEPPRSGAAEERRLRRIAELEHAVEAAGAWDLEKGARALLAELGLADVDARMGTLSGGQRKRVALAHALLVKPDLLLLDEPTNHLDPEVVEWLEGYLTRFTGALFLVTHDRYFLDRVTERIVEVDRGRLRGYRGGYAGYLTERQNRDEQEVTAAHKLQRMARRELEWLRRGPKARTTKAQSRVDRAESLQDQAREARRSVAARRSLTLGLPTSRLGKKILEVRGLHKSYGDRALIQDFSHSFGPGDRIGIIGPNGAGKTTLLEMLAGRLAPDGGEIEVGDTVVIGYYDQRTRELDPERKLIEVVEDVAESIPTTDGSRLTASQMLDRFLFPPAMQHQPTGSLSGGERRRLFLLLLLMRAPNLLLLDEITNDLDIPTLLTLEEALESFPGCVVAVSHDRSFLDRTVTTILRMDGEGAVRQYPGNYADYQAIRDEELAAQAQAIARAAEAASPRAPAAKAARPAAPRRLGYKEKRELEALEQDIARAESRKVELDALLIQHATDYQRARALGAELQDLTADLERKLERWTELAELE